MRRRLQRGRASSPPGGYTKSAAVCRAFLDRHGPGQKSQPDAGGSRGRAGFQRVNGREAGERRGRTIGQGSEVAAGETRAAAEISTRQDRCVSGRPAVERRIADAASYSIRKQGPGVRPGRQVWRGRLVCAARRRSRCFSRAWVAVGVFRRCRGRVRQREVGEDVDNGRQPPTLAGIPLVALR